MAAKRAPRKALSEIASLTVHTLFGPLPLGAGHVVSSKEEAQPDGTPQTVLRVDQVQGINPHRLTQLPRLNVSNGMLGDDYGMVMLGQLQSPDAQVSGRAQLQAQRILAAHPLLAHLWQEWNALGVVEATCRPLPPLSTEAAELLQRDYGLLPGKYTVITYGHMLHFDIYDESGQLQPPLKPPSIMSVFRQVAGPDEQHPPAVSAALFPVAGTYCHLRHFVVSN